MKRITAMLVAAGICLAGCSSNEDDSASAPQENPSTTESVQETAKETQEKEKASPAPTKRSLPPNVKTSRDRAEGNAGEGASEGAGGGRGHKPNPNRSTCGTASANQAVRENISQVKPSHWDWTADYADTDGYDPCAALSWITVTINGATGSSPYQIMLFHYGEYLGTGTSDAYGFMPTVTRASDSAINVVYHYPLPGESNANRSGEAHASFRWSEAENRVIMSGEVPPT